MEVSGISNTNQLVGPYFGGQPTVGTVFPLLFQSSTNGVWQTAVLQGQPSLFALFKGAVPGTNWVALGQTNTSGTDGQFCVTNLNYRFFHVLKNANVAPAVNSLNFTAATVVGATGFQLSWTATVGASYDLQQTTNLFSSPVNWKSVTNIVATGSSMNVTVPFSPNSASQFYRLVQQAN
jgi:hypothetical protein